MMVCVCAAVPEADFLKALEESNGDWRRAAFQCGAGQCCGTCRPFLANLASQAQASKTGKKVQADAIDATSLPA